MALSDDALFIAATGYAYTGTVGTAVKPTPAEVTSFDPTTGLTGWTDLGHTSRDDLPEFGYDGGDTETRGTWQAAAVREIITDPAIDHVTINLHQFDEEGLSLYYGVANASANKGEFTVTGSALTSTERALCIVVVDGATKIAFYAPRASIRREDSVSMAVDEFAVLPLRATFLKPSTGTELFSWISQDTGLNPLGS